MGIVIVRVTEYRLPTLRTKLAEAYFALTVEESSTKIGLDFKARIGVSGRCAVAQSIERLSKGPRSRFNSTEETWVRAPAAA